ncbi:MAG: hypothetical protein JRI55_26425 [Deltaproteobacteria bacterium]|nr:hypothetical protein [Deltaproteobacteria bacterium]
MTILRATASLWLEVVVCAALVGCFDTSLDYPATVGPDGGADGGDDTGFDGDTSQCDLLLEAYQGDYVAAVVNDEGAVELVEGKWVEADQVYESVALVELYGAAKGDEVDLSSQTQYQLCNYCVLVFLGCPPAPAEMWDCESVYIAESGAIDVLEIDPDEPWGNPVEIRVNDAVLVESAVNWSNYHSEPLPDGMKICVGEWHAEAVPVLDE